MEKVIEPVSKNVILYIDNDVCIEYRKGKLFAITDQKEVCILLYKKFKRFLTKFHALERLFRLQPRQIMKISNSLFFISYNSALYLYDLESNEIKLYYKYSKGTNNPLYFCQYNRNGIDEIVFGDYGGHDKRGNIGIYRIIIDKNHFDNSINEISYINCEKIDHIHRIEFDKFRDCYWIFTGDTDQGSCIWKMDYTVNKPIEFLYGKQLFRCCVAFIDEKKLTYITDSPNNDNYVIEVDIDTKTYQKKQKISGSCIYGKIINLGDYQYCFSTTVEPSTEISRLRYLCTYKLGKGIKDRYSHLYIGNKDGFNDVFKVKKDYLPMLLFQFGNIIFPTQYVDNYVYFYLQGCKNKKFKSYRISLNKGEKLC